MKLHTLKKQGALACILLTVEVFLASLACRIIRSVSPAAVLPPLDLPMLVLLSLIPLLIEFYCTKKPCEIHVLSALHAALAFTLLPLCAGLSLPLSAWLMFPVSLLCFCLTALSFSIIERRMLAAPHSSLAPAVNAFLLFLAAQCLHGLI